MATITTTLLVGLAFLCLQSHLAESCSCERRHPQTKYCQHDFLIKARVKASRIIYRKIKRGPADENKHVAEYQNHVTDQSGIEHLNGLITQVNISMADKQPLYKIYNIRISKVLKEVPEYQNVSRTKLYTAVTGSLCGVSLNTSTKYLLGGRLYDGKAWVRLCDTVMEWQKLTVQQRKGANYMYEQHCQCQIQNCYSPKCEKKAHAEGCRLNQRREGEAVCYENNSMCMKRDDGKCHWSRNGMLKNCIKKAQQAKLDEP